MYFDYSMENMNNFLSKKLIELGPIPTNDCIQVCIERLQQKLLCQNILVKRNQLIEKKKNLEENKKKILESKKRIINDPNIKIKNYYYITRKINIDKKKIQFAIIVKKIVI